MDSWMEREMESLSLFILSFYLQRQPRSMSPNVVVVLFVVGVTKFKNDCFRPLEVVNH